MPMEKKHSKQELSVNPPRVSVSVPPETSETSSSVSNVTFLVFSLIIRTPFLIDEWEETLIMSRAPLPNARYAYSKLVLCSARRSIEVRGIVLIGLLRPQSSTAPPLANLKDPIVR